MENVNVIYNDILKEILEKGVIKENRTGVDTISRYGITKRFNVQDSLPALTTKRVALKAVKYELLWFLGVHMDDPKYAKFQQMNIRYLVDNNVKIWNEWPHANYNKLNPEAQLEMSDFINKIKADDTFAKMWGWCGAIYGEQWTNFNGVNQLEQLVTKLNVNPDDRRMIISAWNPPEIPSMLLPPCHYSFQCNSYAKDGKRYLDLSWNQRSVDTFLGLPFNILSYGLLLHILAKLSNHVPNDLIFQGGDVHIYDNHYDQINEQMSRDTEKYPMPTIRWNKDINKLSDITPDSFDIVGYESFASIKGEVAV